MYSEKALMEFITKDDDSIKKYEFTILTFNPKTRRVELQINMKTKPVTKKRFLEIVAAELKKNPNAIFDYDGSLK